MPSIQEAKYKDLPSNTSKIFSINNKKIKLNFVILVLEEAEPAVSTSNDLNKLSLIDSTNTNGYNHQVNHFSLPPTTKPSFIPSSSSITNNTNISTSVTNNNNNNIYTNENLSTNFWLANQTPIVNDPIQEQYDSIPPPPPTQPTTINDAFNSNLSALVQSNNPTNPFSPYGYSMAAQAQSPNINHRQPTIFTPKRGTNPFDDDLIRR